MATGRKANRRTRADKKAKTLAEALRLVVDANVLFAALLRNGTTRRLLLHGNLDLHTLGWLWEEFQRNRAFLVKKSRTTEAAFDLLVDSLRARISDLPLEVIRPHLGEALRRLGREGGLDAPYAAAAMAIRGGVWSHDKQLGERAGLAVLTTKELAVLSTED